MERPASCASRSHSRCYATRRPRITGRPALLEFDHRRLDTVSPIAAIPQDGSIAVIPYGYLDEAHRAKGVQFCRGDEHHGLYATGPQGYYSLRFEPTGEPETPHLVDFVDEFESQFERRRLTYVPDSPLDYAPLFNDAYGDPLVAIERTTPETLKMIDIADEGVRLRALEYLLCRTLPKLWPEIYSDLFTPRRVVALEQERDRIITGRRREIAEIDAALDAERAFFAVYAPLTQLADDALKHLVGRAFTEVFECDVLDLDEQLEEGEPKTLDLLLRRDGWTAFVEVRSSGTRGAQIDYLERMDEHAETVAERYGEPDTKLFVFNGLFRRPNEARTENALFSQRVAEEASSRRITLLSTQVLLRTIEAVRNGDISPAEFIDRLRIPGRFEPVPGMGENDAD